MRFNWKDFLRIALGIFLTGIGVSIIGKSGGELVQMVFGFAFIGIGIAIFMNE